MPIWSRRKRASASSPIAVRSWPSTLDPARGGGLKSADQHQERRLARARGPDQPQRLARRDSKRDPAQNVDRSGIAHEGERDILEGDDRSRHMNPCAARGDSSDMGPGLAFRNLLVALLMVAAASAGARRGPAARLRRLADPGLRIARGRRLRASARGLAARERRPRRRPWSMPASPATPPRAASPASTGRSTTMSMG